MKNKKQIISFSLLIALSVAFVLCCLLLPLVSIKLFNFSSGDLVLDEKYSFLKFVEHNPFVENMDAQDIFFDSPGPVWLTVSMIFLNILTMMGSVILLALSVVGLIFAIMGKTFGFKNSAIYKIAGFVGGFAILSSIAQFVGFVVITSLSNNYIFFISQYGLYINCAVGVTILVCSYLVKNKQGKINRSKVRDVVFFALTAVFSIGIGLMLVLSNQYDYFEPEYSTIYGLNLFANLLAGGYTYEDVPFGVSFYVMLSILVGLIFLVVCSIIGIVRTLKGKSANWLSVRIKRCSRAILDIFSILFILIMCCTIILNLNIIIVEPTRVLSFLSVWFYLECLFAFALVILPTFVGVYNIDKVEIKDQKIENTEQA